jgi:hypothetical protein
MVPRPGRLGAAGLQPTEFVEHLVQQHNQVARLEQAIEGFGVFDECACIRDVDINGSLHLRN